MQTNIIRIKQVVEVLPPLYHRGILHKTPPLLWGPPGIGKSQAVAEAAAAIAEETGEEFKVWDIRLAYYDPVDLRGLPYFNRDGENATYEVAPPSSLPKPGEKGFLFLDEFTLAPPAITNAATQLSLDRKIDNYRLPDGVAVIAASNRQVDRVGGHRIGMQVADRFMHWECVNPVDDVIEHFMEKGVTPLVSQFLRFRPELLNSFEPTGDMRFATQRSWEKAADVVEAGLPVAIRDSVLSGILGDGAAAEFTGFLRVIDSLHNPRAILANPTNYEPPKEISARWAQIGALMAVVDASTANAFMIYMKGYPVEMQFKAVVDLKAKDPELLNTKEGTAWLRKHGDKI